MDFGGSRHGVFDQFLPLLTELLDKYQIRGRPDGVFGFDFGPSSLNSRHHVEEILNLAPGLGPCLVQLNVSGHTCD